MHILVTGGAGFVGSAVAARLVAQGHTVVIVDNFNAYYDATLKHDRVAALVPDVPVYAIDITDQQAFAAVCREHTFDVVCHLAAQAGVRYSVEAPDAYVASNVRGTQVVLETMQQLHIPHLVFASTSSVYGTTTPAPFRESDPADRPVSVYAATKRAGELLAYTYHTQYGISATCLRFFTVYGPWSRPDMAMLSFAQKLSKGKSIQLFNFGKLRRDFTHIDDIVSGFARAVEQPLGYEIINLGSGNPIALEHFVEVLARELGMVAAIERVPMQQGDMFETYADISKASALLGYTPTVSFEQGVRSFIDWFLTYYRARDE